MLIARHVAACAVALALPLVASSAQNPVSECVNGAPVVPAGAGVDPSAAKLLARLAWNTSYGDYRTITAADGQVVALDSIIRRGDALLAVSGNLTAVSTARDALDSRLATLRRELAAMPLSALAAGHTPSFSALSVSSTVAGRVEFVKDQAGDRPALIFDPANPMPAIALCAIAKTTTSFLDGVAQPQFQAVAAEYATAVKHWDVYIKQGYSMTFVERLGNSCRLGFFNWIVAPTVAGRCGAEPWKKLGPPAARVIFAHPSAGWAPVFDKTSAGRAASVFEWYGIVFSPFVGDRMLPMGVSVSTMSPDAGKPQLGLTLHTPIGSVGGFRAGSSTFDKRGRFLLMADATSWFPGNASATATQLLSFFGSRAGQTIASLAK